jgi:hypothetical protein
MTPLYQMIADLAQLDAAHSEDLFRTIQRRSFPHLVVEAPAPRALPGVDPG